MNGQTAGPGARVLRRSRSDRVVGGVCGGIGQYFGVDPVLIRIVAVALALSGGTGVLAYLIAWIAIPEDDSEPEPHPWQPPRRAASSTVTLVLGAVLVVVGVLLLLRQVIPWFGLELTWPILLVMVGALIIASARSAR
jgi:phage shock protein C